jgi:His/Glu/Gln/Arg/opine family amino acid ABC transporter permease subunit
MAGALLNHDVLAAIGEGLKTTLLLSAALVGVMVAVGIPVGVLETSERPVVRLPARAMVEFFRGIPTIVTLFFVFFFLPSIGLLVPAFYAVLIGLSLWGSANVAEITRGAVASVDHHQWLAAAALSMSRGRTIAYVVIPIALRRMLPPLVSFTASAIQATILASAVGLPEVLTRTNEALSSLSFFGPRNYTFAAYSAIMCAFFVMSFPLTYGARRLEAILAR